MYVYRAIAASDGLACKTLYLLTLLKSSLNVFLFIQSKRENEVRGKNSELSMYVSRVIAASDGHQCKTFVSLHN